MKRLLFVLSFLACLFLISPTKVPALSPLQIVPDVKEKFDIVVVPTSTPVPTVSLKLRSPDKTFTVIATTTPSPTTSPSPVQATASSTPSPTITSVEQIDDSAKPLDSTLSTTLTPVQTSESESRYDLKEIIGISLVIFLILVIVFQSRMSHKKESSSDN